jgi:hypothetical protein
VGRFYSELGYNKENIMTASKLFLASLVLAAGFATSAAAQQDPDTGGNLNRCWGEVARQTAQYQSTTQDDTEIVERGGGMGTHSRSTTAANKVGGFTNTTTNELPFDLTFNELNADGNHSRLGVANATRGAPHNAEPGDGGNGQHAINNGQLVGSFDPTTGQALEDGQLFECSVAP